MFNLTNLDEQEGYSKEFGYDEKRPSYFIRKFVIPLIEEGKLRYILPDKPKGKNQRIISA